MESLRDTIEATDSGTGRLLTLSLGATFLGLIPTVYAAAISNSVVLLADLLRCSAEFIAVLISWMIVRKISGADRLIYNYGLGKLEYLSTIAVSGALIVTFLISLFVSVLRFISPVPLENAGFGFILAILSVLANSALWFTNYRQDKKAPSPVTDSQWRLFRAKAIATGVVSITLGTSLLFKGQAWTIYMDPVGSLLLAGFMLYSAVVMLSSAVPILVDRAVEEEIQAIILSSLLEHEGRYAALEKIRTRRTGKRVFVDIFLTFDGTRPFSEIHAAVMDIKEVMRAKLSDAEVIVIPSLRE